MYGIKGGKYYDRTRIIGHVLSRENQHVIDTFHKNQPEKSKMEDEYILLAEIFIEKFPIKEKELVGNYISSLINQLSLEEAFLYQHGFMDGVKPLKYIGKI
ncbi:hypothetical protein [Lacrimispora indolis]|uniref:hypothetical protein n=1 Tax=Lacrimispora indolis TaxID=69825 RepID=UPI0004627412|nr:hypothetical protein [[Clostridium] methoxybenzovorans]